MSTDAVLRILKEGLLLIITISALPMLAGMITGLVVSVLQATTQIQEQTLSFVPKLLAIFDSGDRLPAGCSGRSCGSPPASSIASRSFGDSRLWICCKPPNGCSPNPESAST